MHSTATTPESDFSRYLEALGFEANDRVCIGHAGDKRLSKASRPFGHAWDSCGKLAEQFEEIARIAPDENVYLCMAPFIPGASERKKPFVSGARHAFIEADENGAEVLAHVDRDIKEGLVPVYALVVESSPGKFHVVWNIESGDFTSDGKFDKDKHESLLDTLQKHYGTDSASTDTARFLRLPGFRNCNYDEQPWVRLAHVGDKTRRKLADFKIMPQGSAKGCGPFQDAPKRWLDEGPIPRGTHDITLTQIGGHYRSERMEEDEIFEKLVACEPRCIGHGDDFEPMCRKIAISVSRYEPEPEFIMGTGTTQANAQQAPAPGSATTPATATDALLKQAAEAAELERIKNWKLYFRSVDDLPEGGVAMLIRNFLPEGFTVIGALPGETKTLLLLSIAKALTSGKPLFGNPEWSVPNRCKVIYMIPESSGRAFKKRCRAFGITGDKDWFVCRTISEGATLSLTDPIVQQGAREGWIFILDTLIRFSKSDNENDAAQNKKLGDDVTALRQLGCPAVLAAHHATKMLRTEHMSLENILRGTSDIAAQADAVYGLKRDDKLHADGAGPLEVDVVCSKPRDIEEPPRPFRLAAKRLTRPGEIGSSRGLVSIINETGDFRLITQAEVAGQQADKAQRTETELVLMVQAHPEMTLRNLRELLTDPSGMTLRKVAGVLKLLGWAKASGKNQLWAHSGPQTAEPVRAI